MIDKEYALTEQDIIVTKTNINGVITYVNDDLLRITGYSEQELIGSNHNIFRHPDMPAEAFSDLWRTILSESTWRGVVKNKTKDGGFYWVHADVTPLYEHNAVVGFMSVRVKPTSEEIQKAEKAYEQMKAGTFTGMLFYGDIIENTIEHHIKRRFDDVNISTKFASLIGLSIFVVMLVAALDHSALNRLNDNQQKTLTQIQSYSHTVNLEYEAHIKSLEEKLASYEPQNHVEYKKNKNDSLLNERFYQVKTLSNQALSDVQIRNMLIVVFVLIVLILLYEFIIRSVVNPLKETQEGLKELSNGVYRIPIQHRSKNELGKMMEALRTTSVRLGFDIANEKKISSEIIRVHEKNLALNAEINQLQRLESIARMTAGIAHNFNNSLGAIIGYNQLNCYAAEDCQDEMVKQEILQNTQQIQIASDRSVELVKQMMAYTNQNSARKFREMKSIVVVIDEVLEMIDTSLTNRFQIQTNIDSNLDFQFDATDLHLILTALMINARDAMQEKGGVITVTLKKITFNEVVCSSCLTVFEGECIELCVSDQGIGIDNHVITHIFDPFFTLKPTGEGMGLGLTTASGLVHEANGHIIVESKTTEPDSGTIFRLLFPIVNAA
jgi:PAS domain S-box-containing protein